APIQNATVKATAANGVFGTANANVGTTGGAGSVNLDLSPAKAYPVPFKSSSGDPGITFTGLTVNSTIKIFTGDGHLVVTIHTDGPTYPWGLINGDNEKVSSGVYYYRIDNGTTHKEGNLVIIQ